MNKNGVILWLRISFWAGAIIDFIAAIPMLFPQFTGIAFGFNVVPDPAYRYAMGIGGALMIGWTVLLVWADQNPLVRKGVLLITVFPVILGIVCIEIWAVLTGFIPVGKALPNWILQTVLISLFVGSYLNAARFERLSK